MPRRRARPIPVRNKPRPIDRRLPNEGVPLDLIRLLVANAGVPPQPRDPGFGGPVPFPGGAPGGFFPAEPIGPMRPINPGLLQPRPAPGIGGLIPLPGIVPGPPPDPRVPLDRGIGWGQGRRRRPFPHPRTYGGGFGPSPPRPF